MIVFIGLQWLHNGIITIITVAVIVGLFGVVSGRLAKHVFGFMVEDQW